MIKIKLAFVVLFFEISALLFLSISTANADTAVNVDRVRWKKKIFTWRDHDNYREWSNEGIWTENRKKTYISTYLRPAKNDTRTMVMLISGQQGSSGSSGGSNCVTGQNESWSNGWGKGDKTKTTHIKDYSLADRLLDSGHIDRSNTFFSIVFNSNFNWGSTLQAKQKALKAHTNWFLKHGNPSQVDRIILIGSSRGGALAMRMSKRIKQLSGWNNVPVFVGLLDAVPNKGQNELSTNNSSTCDNPLNGSYYARKANLNAFFGSLNKPQIRHIVTGSPVIEAGNAVHAFCSDESTWYEQSWANLKHKEIGRCNTNEGGAYESDKMNKGIVKLYNWTIEKLYQ